MKHLFFLSLTIFCLHQFASAQTDTTIVYLNEGGETTKENAVSYIEFYRQDKQWHGKEFFLKNGILKSEGSYLDATIYHPVGTFKNYSEKGVLLNIATFNDSSILKERTYFYENGVKQAWIHNAGPGALEQRCWDSTGKEAPFCKVEIEARFKGGMEGWKKFLERNINASVAEESGAPVGTYTVEVQFAVSKDGDVSNIHATRIPAHCEPCATEVVRLLSKSPRWEPATLNGVPYDYLAKQYITFLVEERKGKRKRN